MTDGGGEDLDPAIERPLDTFEMSGWILHSIGLVALPQITRGAIEHQIRRLRSSVEIGNSVPI